MWNTFRNRVEKLAAERPVMLAFLVFLSAAVIVIPVSIPFILSSPASFLQNVVAEAYGTLFDLLIIGWLLLWLNKLADRRQRKNRYREEIEDVLGWQSPEVAHRITSNIRRLNRTGVLRGLHLTEAYLKGANLTEASLREADLWGANLQQTTLRRADLRGANLGGVTLEEADLEQANMQQADLRGANLKAVDLERANAEEVRLAGADLSGADLQYTTLKKADLQRATLYGANLHGADLERADLRGASLREANLLDADLEEADLRDADLRNAHLERADLRSTTLDGADLRHTDLRDVTLPDDDLAAFSHVRSLHGALLDPSVEERLRDGYPHLFDDHQNGKAPTDVVPTAVKTD